MAHVVVMPKLGNTVESCVIVGWKAAVGDTVAPGTMLCEIETDKATMEVQAGAEGILLRILKSEGEDVPVLEPIAVIGLPGETWEGGAAQTSAHASAQVPSQASAQAASRPDPSPADPAGASASTPIATSLGTEFAPAPGAGPAQGGLASPRARGLAQRSGLPLDSIVTGTGPGGRILERDVVSALGTIPSATVAARDLEALAKLWSSGKRAVGTGLGGRLTAADVEAAAAAPTMAAAAGAAAAAAQASSVQVAPNVQGASNFQGAPNFRSTPNVQSALSSRAAPIAPVAQSAQVAHSAPAAIPEIPGPHQDTPIRSIRKIIADRMLSSLRNTAQITLNSSAPAERLLAMRARFKATNPASGYSTITLGDLVAYAAVKVLAKHPRLNAHVLDGLMRTYERIHLGLAVDTPRGLMVPTLADADSLSMREFSARSKKLAADCLSGAISPDLLSGGTFTVTNLGAFGVESFTPVLNEPQTAILGVNAILPRPTLGEDGSLGAEMRIGFSLTVDHRVVDGADAARYLKDLGEFVSSIDLALLG